jgi:hypothetical protein
MLVIKDSKDKKIELGLAFDSDCGTCRVLEVIK